MQRASTRSEPKFGVMIILYCCQLQLTKKLLQFPLLSQPWGWDGASLPGNSRTAAQGFLCRPSSRRKSLFFASLELYMAKGTYLSTSDSNQQKGNCVYAMPESLWGGKCEGRRLVQVR